MQQQFRWLRTGRAMSGLDDMSRPGLAANSEAQRSVFACNNCLVPDLGFAQHCPYFCFEQRASSRAAGSWPCPAQRPSRQAGRLRRW